MEIACAYIQIAGPADTRTYRFTVHKRLAILGLPQDEIDALGLTPIPNGRQRFPTSAGIVELDAYGISGTVLAGRPAGKGFAAMVVPAPRPAVGYEMLQTMRLRVNPVSEEVEEVPDDEFHPPYFISMFT